MEPVKLEIVAWEQMANASQILPPYMDHGHIASSNWEEWTQWLD
jgi:hypothetical protein